MIVENIGLKRNELIYCYLYGVFAYSEFIIKERLESINSECM